MVAAPAEAAAVVASAPAVAAAVPAAPSRPAAAVCSPPCCPWRSGPVPGTQSPGAERSSASSRRLPARPTAALVAATAPTTSRSRPLRAARCPGPVLVGTLADG
eukprot:10711825-Alexandrium_andersonii.AAC.1